VNALYGPVAVAAVLLVVAGAAKVLQPAPAVSAMRAVGLWSSAWLVRLGALAECAIGLAALTVDSTLARAAVAISFGGFALFLEVARRSGNVRDCGCFGQEGAAPSIRAVIVDVALALACAASLWAAPLPALDLLARHALTSVAFLACVCSGAVLWRYAHDQPLRRRTS